MITVSPVRAALAGALVVVLLATGGCGQTELPPARSILDDGSTPDSIDPFESFEGSSTTDVTTSPTGPAETPVTTPVATVDDGTDAGPDDAVGDWQDITTSLVGIESTCGNVSFVAADPASDAVLVNIARFGLFALADDASGWFPIGADGDRIDHRTQWIEFDPEVPTRYWVSGAYGDGVFVTEDGGASFVGLPGIEHVDRVAVDMADPERQTLLAGSHEDRSLWKSTDGGQTWTDISPSLPLGSGFSSVPVVLAPDVYLLGTYRSDGAGIFRSEDGGQSWTQVFDDEVIGAPVVTEEFIAWNRAGGGLAVSTDAGVTFEAPGPSPGRPSPTLVRGPGDTLVTTYPEGVVVTPDLGRTWAPVGQQLPFEADGVAYSAARNELYVWRHSCEFGEQGNPVAPASILQATVGATG